MHLDLNQEEVTGNIQQQSQFISIVFESNWSKKATEQEETAAVNVKAEATQLLYQLQSHHIFPLFV